MRLSKFYCTLHFRVASNEALMNLILKTDPVPDTRVDPELANGHGLAFMGRRPSVLEAEEGVCVRKHLEELRI